MDEKPRINDSDLTGCETAASVSIRLHDAQSRLVRHLGITPPQWQKYMQEIILQRLTPHSPENRLFLEWSAALAAYADWVEDDPHAFDDLAVPPHSGELAVWECSVVVERSWRGGFGPGSSYTTLFRTEALAWEFAARQIDRYFRPQEMGLQRCSKAVESLRVLIDKEQYQEAVNEYHGKFSTLRFRIQKAVVHDRVTPWIDPSDPA